MDTPMVEQAIVCHCGCDSWRFGRGVFTILLFFVVTLGREYGEIEVLWDHYMDGCGWNERRNGGLEREMCGESHVSTTNVRRIASNGVHEMMKYLRSHYESER